MPRPDSFERRVQEFLQHLRETRGAAERTASNYERDLKHCAAWLKGAAPVRAGACWENASHLLLSRYVRECARDLAPHSVRRRVSVLKVFYRWLNAHGALRENPAELLKAPRCEPRRAATLTVQEIEKLLAVPDLLSAAGKRDRALIEVLYATGMRAGECAALAVDDILWRSGEVLIRPPAREGASRLVFLGRPALQALRSYVENGRPELLRRYEYHHPHTAPPASLWISRRGAPLTVVTIGVVVSICARDAKIGRRVTPVMLRHACAEHLLANGADPEAVRALCGYKSPQGARLPQRGRSRGGAGNAW